MVMCLGHMDVVTAPPDTGVGGPGLLLFFSPPPPDLDVGSTARV